MPKEDETKDSNACGITKVQKIFSGKWKIMILWILYGKTLRFGELSRKLGDITQSALTKQLRELETDGLVRRHVYPEVPPKVEYSLTKIGNDFFPLIKQINVWSEENL